ncbi:VOC family protein [Ornithinimicrobium sp. Y1694]|uniref:VOC family protein n=1 Tax=Ornithinimicrobium sp. Y1694 TaxID=3418590 RepID=UPI003CE7E57A
MVERTTPWPVGAPSWADVLVSDMERSKAFYTAVFGWEYTGGEADFGGYVTATKDGRAVVGLAPPMEGAEDQESAWTVYLAVEDSAATEQAITEAGGVVYYPTMEVGPFGRMGIYGDPTGAAFGTWEPASHAGFGVTNEPGSMAWNEAMVGDFAAGKTFYTEVFGWTYADMSGEGMEYAIFTTPGDESGMTGGIGHDPDQEPAWTVVLEVDGTDEAVQRIKVAGGSVLVEPFDFEHGRLALVAGPDNEPFGVITSAAPPEEN